MSEKTNKKTRTVGNGEGSLYYSESRKKWIFAYFIHGEKHSNIKISFLIFLLFAKYWFGLLRIPR